MIFPAYPVVFLSIVIARSIDYARGRDFISPLVRPFIKRGPSSIGRIFSKSANHPGEEDELISDEMGTSKNEKKSSEEDLAKINRILAKKFNDYYGILELSRGATLKEIDQAFKRLALCVHPDKTCAPEAKEATQRLIKARDELIKKLDKSNAGRNERIFSIKIYHIVRG